MSKILIVGCGFVGAKAAEGLCSKGHEVIGTTHREASAIRLGAAHAWRVMPCDVSQVDSVHALRDSIGPVDTVIHCASSGRGGAEMYERVYLNGMNHLASVFPEAWLLYTSSTSVYSQIDGSTVDETTPAEPDRETGRLLRAAEQVALQRGGAVARLAGIYGPGRSFLLKNLLEGKSAIEVCDSAPAGRLINQIHVEDAARALVHLATERLAGIWNVVDDAQLTQRVCLERLAGLFGVQIPEVRSPDAARKRGWSHKHVSNQKLRTSGWSPIFPDYFTALQDDESLVSSILAEIDGSGEAPVPRCENIVLMGLMGCGKSSVGRITARLLGFQFIDTDHLISDAAGCSIPEIFAKEGERGFRQRESAVLRSLIGTRHSVIATGGGIITQPVNLPLLKHLGFITWLEAEVDLLVRRTAGNNDRPLLRGEEPPRQKLQSLLLQRGPIYQTMADLRIQTDELTQEESAYGVAESARIFFARRRSDGGVED
jgi:shikimate kinase/nucleoside-diphosphate-sugar epimerase